MYAHFRTYLNYLSKIYKICIVKYLKVTLCDVFNERRTLGNIIINNYALYILYSNLCEKILK